MQQAPGIWVGKELRKGEPRERDYSSSPPPATQSETTAYGKYHFSEQSRTSYRRSLLGWHLR